MSSSTARTGKDGKAVVDGTLIARLTQWNFQETADGSAWGDSDGAGYTNRTAGRKDLTGTIEGKFDTDDDVYDVFRPGDIVELILWQTTTAGDYWALPRVLIQNFSLTYNVDTQEVVGWTANFGSDGIYYAPGEAGAPSETLPS